ncbi:TonB-dependent receptor [Parasphingorhabdus litoris]|uniref:TonB-dependent receptor n=1 Tax=Parasphingorhabdus litoris TaxID=394733 RepID=A0ABN1B0H5_9SPHN|nr:TonB-dependent receptor [Parasphingorhabdus litoris]
MKKFTKLMSGTAPVVLGLAMVSAPAHAQDQDAQEADAADEEVIVVTGSRISNPNLELSSPVGVVTSEELELRQTNVAEQFLRELPSAIPSIGSAVNNGNGGSSFVNLRGIGSVRNLVLLDGRRFVPADTTGRVDLNSIPLAVIERTDVLTGGATTTYGADAISGVVNFITKRDFAGIELNLSEQITEQGDGNVFRADLTIGANFDDGRGNAVLSVGYQDQDAVFQGDRSFGEFNVNSFNGNPGGSSNAVPANVIFNSLIDPATICDPATLADPDNEDLCPTITGSFLRDGQQSTFTGLGFTGGVSAQLNGDGSDIISNDPTNLLDNGEFNPTPFNFNPFNIFQTPFERFNIFGSARYELNENIELYSQAAFSKQTVSTIIAPGGSFFNTYTFNLNNPNIPEALAERIGAGLGLTGAAYLAARNTQFGPTGDLDGDPSTPDVANPDYTTFQAQVRRRTVEVGTRNSEFTSTLFNIVVGARGAITDNINYDVSATYGESERIQRQSGFARRARIDNAILALPDGTCVNGGGDGCVPINFFGTLGNLGPQEAQDYVFNLTQQVITGTSIATVNGTVSGDLGFGFSETPIQFAVGGEYREFTATRLSDEASQTPGAVVGGGGAAPDINGSYDVYDAFAEVSIPVFEGESFAESLTIDLGARYSDYSTAGTEFTWKAGGSWEVIPGLTFRGNYQRSSRAPNIGELFTPVSTQLSNLANDPCQGPVTNDDGTVTGSIPTGDLLAACLLQVPAGSDGAAAIASGNVAPPAAGQINITTGGNLELGTETAKTWTVGVAWQPDFVPGLSVTLDYFNIKVTEAISAPTPGDAIAACFDAPSATNEFCGQDFISRSAFTGGLDGDPAAVLGLILPQTNDGTIETDGIDLSIRYNTPVTDSIDLAMSFDGTWTNKNLFQASSRSLNRECVGFYSVNCNPQSEFAFTQRTSLTFEEDFTLSLRWRFLSGVEQEPQDIIDNGEAFIGNSPLFGDVDFTKIPSESYFDLTGQWDISDNVLLTVTVQNLFDNSPTVVGSNIGSTAFNSGNIYPSSYDALGRRYGASVKFSF